VDSADESPGEFQLAYGTIILHESCISGLVGGCYICLGCMSVWRSVTLTYYICGFILDGCAQCRRVSRCFPPCIWNHNIARIMYLRSGWSIVASLEGVCLLVAQNTTMGGVSQTAVYSADESPGGFQLVYVTIILHESCISGLVGAW